MNDEEFEESLMSAWLDGLVESQDGERFRITDRGAQVVIDSLRTNPEMVRMILRLYQGTEQNERTRRHLHQVGGPIILKYVSPEAGDLPSDWRERVIEQCQDSAEAAAFVAGVLGDLADADDAIALDIGARVADALVAGL